MEKMLTATITSSSVIPAFELLYFFLSNCHMLLSYPVIYKNTVRGALISLPSNILSLLRLSSRLSSGCVLRVCSFLTVCCLAVSAGVGSRLFCGCLYGFLFVLLAFLLFLPDSIVPKILSVPYATLPAFGSV